MNLVQRENFELGYLQREIGFEPENDLSYKLARSNILEFMQEKF